PVDRGRSGYFGANPTRTIRRLPGRSSTCSRSPLAARKTARGEIAQCIHTTTEEGLFRGADSTDHRRPRVRPHFRHFRSSRNMEYKESTVNREESRVGSEEWGGRWVSSPLLTPHSPLLTSHS